jgi:hypothetical protein
MIDLIISFQSREICTVTSFVTCTSHRILLDDQVKEDEMDRACSTSARELESVEGFGKKT